MEPTKINCYLCSNQEAKKDESVEAPRNYTVKCPECTEYEVPNRDIDMIFKRKDGKEYLDEYDKKKIIREVKKHYKQGKKPLLITKDFIYKVTGKRSIHTTYI